MAYQTQQWTAPQGTGLNRYAKGTETETHITLTLDPENLTNSPTPFTAERMAHIESGIADAYAIENVYPIEWREYALGQTTRRWVGMTTLGNDVYACVSGGDIYKQTGGTGDFIALGQTLRAWRGMTTLGNDVYACVNGGDIYKQTGGTGDFVALGQTSRNWRGMTTLGNDVYACVQYGDIYKLSLSNTIRASADFTLSAYPDGSRKRIANTHATNIITVTAPSGQTILGLTSIPLGSGRIVELELISTDWKSVNETVLVDTCENSANTIGYIKYSSGRMTQRIAYYSLEGAGWVTLDWPTNFVRNVVTAYGNMMPYATSLENYAVTIGTVSTTQVRCNYSVIDRVMVIEGTGYWK